MIGVERCQAVQDELGADIRARLSEPLLFSCEGTRWLSVHAHARVQPFGANNRGGAARRGFSAPAALGTVAEGRRGEADPAPSSRSLANPQTRSATMRTTLALLSAATLAAACGSEHEFAKVRRAAIERRAPASSAAAASSAVASRAATTASAAVNSAAAATTATAAAATRTDEASAAGIQDPAQECAAYYYPPVGALIADGVFPAIWEIASLRCVPSRSEFRSCRSSGADPPPPPPRAVRPSPTSRRSSSR